MRTERLSTSRTQRLSRPAKATRRSLSIQSAVETWLADNKAQGFSKKTTKERQGFLSRVIWWIENEAGTPDPSLDDLTSDSIRRFLAYVREPHPTGRFGSSHPTAKQAARPLTVSAYFRELKAFLRFCLAEGVIDENPMVNVKPPRVPNDQIQPLSPQQVQALLDATAHTVAPDRNKAILMTLVDSGLRVSELCSLTIGDVIRETGEIAVTGKGGKRRHVYLGTTSRRALRFYLNKHRRHAEEDEPVFVSEGGTCRGQGLTPSGVLLMMRDCGKLAGIEGVRCSPHTLRHTFCINALRGGMNLLELQRIAGHADLGVLKRYVALSASDLAQAHRMASPADRLKLK